MELWYPGLQLHADGDMLIWEASEDRGQTCNQVLLRLSQVCWIDRLESIVKSQE